MSYEVITVNVWFRYVQLEVATPASLKLGRNQNMQEDTVNEIHEVSLVDGEEIEVVCEARGAYPQVQFVWSIPGNKKNIGIYIQSTALLKDIRHSNFSFFRSCKSHRSY